MPGLRALPCRGPLKGMPLQGKDPKVARWFINPPSPERSLLRLISSQPARTLPEVASLALPDQALTCWAALVAGSGSLQATSQRVRALPFRCERPAASLCQAAPQPKACSLGGSPSQAEASPPVPQHEPWHAPARAAARVQCPWARP